MRNGSAIVFSGVAPHPPIMVPEVGGDAISEVRGSIDAMAELSHRIVENGAETVILVSPHAPLDATAFVAYTGSPLYGDFGNFRAPHTSVEFPLDPELLEAITNSAHQQRYGVIEIEHYPLDHGSLVPLYFLSRNGWRGRVVAMGYSFLSNKQHVEFGRCVKAAADRVGRPVAFIASGDLSHRLKPEAPAGYNASAHIFDEQVVDALTDNAPERILEIDQDLRRTAGECGYRSLLVGLGATEGLPNACEVLNYEAPFGVGYLVAQFTNQRELSAERVSTSVSHDQLSSEITQLARAAVEEFTRTGERIAAPEVHGLLAERAACFVSLKTRGGDLRGCIGTIEPTQENLAEEIIMNGINSAIRDPRFHPVEPSELDDLVYSVDVLSPPEPANFEDLDPAIYGLIVEDESGRRGLLLPALAGVDTAEKQLDITMRKAGIAPGSKLKLSRFRVERFREQ